MRSNVIITGILFFVCLVVQGQSNEELSFTKEFNELYKLNSNRIFDAFRVVEESTVDSVVVEASKEETQAYKKALATFKKLRRDSVRASSKNFSNSTSGNNEVYIVKAKINAFLKSKESYDVKKEFNLLSRKPLDLKVHLKRLLPKIKVPGSSGVAAKPIKGYEEVDVARKELQRTERYVIVEGSTEVAEKSTLHLGSLIFKPENIIIGIN